MIRENIVKVTISLDIIKYFNYCHKLLFKTFFFLINIEEDRFLICKILLRLWFFFFV